MLAGGVDGDRLGWMRVEVQRIGENVRLIDYNNSRTFSFDVVVARYAEFCRRRGVKEPIQFVPRKIGGPDKFYVYPVWNDVINGIRQGDPACVDLGIWCLSVVEPIPFGPCIRGGVVRELIRGELRDDQKGEIRQVVTRLLVGRHPLAPFKRLGRLFIATDPREEDFDAFLEADGDDRWVARRKAHMRMRKCWWLEARGGG